MIENLFQITKSPSWEIITWSYTVPLLQFHLFDDSYHSSLINEKIQSCTDERVVFCCSNNSLKIYVYTHAVFVLFFYHFHHVKKVMIQMKHLHFFLIPLYIIYSLTLWLLQIFLSLYDQDKYRSNFVLILEMFLTTVYVTVFELYETN